MSFETQEKSDTMINPHPLTNVQLEILKLYSTDLGKDDLVELREVLSNHFAQKAIKDADKIWDKKKMSAETMEKWLNE